MCVYIYMYVYIYVYKYVYIYMHIFFEYVSADVIGKLASNWVKIEALEVLSVMTSRDFSIFSPMTQRVIVSGG